MNNETTTNAPAADGEDIAAIYGTPMPEPELTAGRKVDFKPWHHPVKQVVREYQWRTLTQRLLSERTERVDVLHYFTLPGPDLFDVTMLSHACRDTETAIRYFGFDAARDQEAPELDGESSSNFTAESVLRQSGVITSDAVILPDRLEDIAHPNSQAASQLSMQPAFDVINLDACDHLAYTPKGRSKTTFDALSILLRHQMLNAKRPWLLFLTTRVDSKLSGEPVLYFQKAIMDNVTHSPQDFGGALAAAISTERVHLPGALQEAWVATDERFLKVYSIGLGKFLLQYFHGQPNLPSEVELASAYCYRVHHTAPDMLALAFRITPRPPRVFNPSLGGAALIPNLEPSLGAQIAKKAQNLKDLDTEINDADVMRKAVQQTETLLNQVRYDVDAWRSWVASHPTRPLQIPVYNDASS